MTAGLPSAFRRFLLAVGIFGAGDFSRTLLILWALGVGVRITGSGQLTLQVLLYAAYNVVGAASAYLFGGWSDRIGRRPLLLFGYALAGLVSVLIALDWRSMPLLLAVFLGSGVFIGIEETLERATAADLLPEGSRAFGFGALATVNGIGDLVSSTMVGFLWQTAGATVAFGTAAVLSIAGTLLLRSVAFSSTNTEVHT
jgi:MFS family permease